jgi:hypothetical protein
MSIEENLVRTNELLEKIAQHLSHLGRLSGAPETVASGTVEDKKPEVKDKKPAAKTTKKVEPKVSKEDVRAALQELVGLHGRDAAIDLLREHADGAESLSQLDEAYFGPVLAAAKEAVDAAPATDPLDDI